MGIQNFFNWFKDEECDNSQQIHTLKQNASNPFLQLHQKIDKLFNDTFRSLGTSSSNNLRNVLKNDTLLRPYVNISGSDKAYSVNVEIPGVNEDDLTLELSNRMLIISGEKKIQNEKKDKNFYRVECSYGSFQRVLSLPEDVDENNIEAKFENGILMLTLPRKILPKHNVKHINIKKIK